MNQIWIALSRITAFISCKFVALLRVSFKIAKETFGVGTLTALADNFHSNDAITLLTALPAPVDVITMFIAADLPLIGFLCILSNKFWSFE